MPPTSAFRIVYRSVYDNMIPADSRLGLMAAVACLLFAFATGVTALKSTPIGWDEVNTAFHLFSNGLNKQRTVAETVAGLAKGSPEHGPLYFALLNVWNKLAGSDLFVLRLASVYFGVIGVAVAFRLAAISRDRATAPTATILISFLAFYSYFLLEIRPYALLATLSGLVLWTYWRALSCPGPVRNWRCIALFATSALLLYTHYFGAVILAAIGAYHLLLARKRANWWRVTLAIAAAVLAFAAWLPVALPALINPRHDLSGERLSFLSSLGAIAAIFSNGLVWLPPAAMGILFFSRERLGRSEVYIISVTSFAVLLIVVANEFVPIVVDYRLRYLHILALPIACALSIALTKFAASSMLRNLLIILWIAAGFVYKGTDAFGIYSGRRVQDVENPLHLQDFVYQSEHVPGHNGIILAYYPIESGAVEKRLRYYWSVLEDWDDIVNVWQDEAGDIEILSDRSAHGSLDGITANANALWLIHNPQRTDFESTDFYRGWLTNHFKSCKRIIEKVESVIEVYVKHAIPCALVADDEPFGLDYENGTRLANVEHKISPNELVIYLWWRNTIDGVYSVSLQLFDDRADRVAQLDAVIADQPIDIFSFDVSALAEGEYVLQLIVYDFVSKVSQPGEFVAGQERFERAVEILRFNVGA